MNGLDLCDPDAPRQAAEWAWMKTLERVGKKDHPTRRELADLVRAHGVPMLAADYMAKRLRDEIHLGDGGRPPPNDKVWWERTQAEVFTRWAERRRKRYQRLRFARPLEQRVNPWGVSVEEGRPKQVRRVRVLELGHWVWTEEPPSGWKIRAPIEYAIRRVALRYGWKPEKLARWRKKLRSERLPNTDSDPLP